MTQMNPADTLPASSQDALEIFDERYLAAIGVVPPQTWVDELGESSPTPALTTRYPMSILSFKYLETIAPEGRFRTIGEKDVDLTVAEYDDGVEIDLLKLLTNTFAAKRWTDAPARMVQAEAMFRLKLIADALVANTETCGWDGLALFHDAHLSNPLVAGSPTFDNLQATTKDVANLTSIEEEITAMLEVLDENGDPLNVTPDTVGVPRQKWQKMKNLLKQDFVPTAAGTATMRNPYNDNSLNVVRMDQLTDANDWLPLRLEDDREGRRPVDDREARAPEARVRLAEPPPLRREQRPLQADRQDRGVEPHLVREEVPVPARAPQGRRRLIGADRTTTLTS